MTAMELLTKEIWSTARKFKGEGPITAVVAYVTDNPLKLSKGDVLVCDASDSNVSAGAVSAKVLSRLHSGGVKVFHYAGLHAKFVRLPNHVLLGSSNMTNNTERLLEVAILTSDVSLLGQVDKLIETLWGDKNLKLLTTQKIKKLLDIPVIKFSARIEGKTEGPKLWISAVDPLHPEEEEKTSEFLRGLFVEEDISMKRFVIFSSRDTKMAKNIKVGDLFIEVDEEANMKGPLEVEVVARRPPKIGGGIVIVLANKRIKTREWNKLRELINSFQSLGDEASRPRLMELEGDDRLEAERIFNARK